MPQTKEGMLLFIGAIFFLIGILGGGFEISAIKIPSVGKFVRIISGGVGVIFTGISLSLCIFPLVHPQPTTDPNVSGTPTAIAAALPTSAVQPGGPPALMGSPAPPSPFPPETILFQENFEGEKPLPFAFIDKGDWKQASDETGNQVYEIDNTSGTEYPQIRFGSGLWKNYKLEFRTRILDIRSPESSVFCIFRLQNGRYYQLNMNLQSILLGIEPPFQELGSRWTSFGKGIWFSIRAEAQEMQIRVFLDNNLIIETTDSRPPPGRHDTWSRPRHVCTV